ncbi:37S ribosomal protein S25, mitochondrial [Mycena venus]|uniref:Small ribosomal subunit protein mS23 n=1 Tax=Mycena venus TaxID=2733690 RepID=A0A8H7CU85_9AGAR|nr:37S ribosomal protein S25, mitochondrial [Mycena venus]
MVPTSPQFSPASLTSKSAASANAFRPKNEACLRFWATTQTAPPKKRPLPIHYIEDDIRRQFYADHPFEAFRPTTLVEKGDIEQHEVTGAGWTRLRQRGRNPTPEEYAPSFFSSNSTTAIQFTLNLKEYHKIPLSQAYARAIAQFRALRSEHHIATTFAVLEAEALGAVFVRGEIEHAFEKEKRALATWERLDDIDEGSLAAARKRWKMIAERHVGGVPVVEGSADGEFVDGEQEPESGEDGSHDVETRAGLGSSDADIGDVDSGDDVGESGVLTMEELQALVKDNLFVEDGEGFDEDGELEEGEWEEGEEANGKKAKQRRQT